MGLGNFFFRGRIDDKSVIGKIDTKGNTLWLKELNYIASSIKRLSAHNSQIENSLFVCGNTSSERKEGNKGFVSLYNTNGNLLSNKIVSEYEVIIFNSIIESGHKRILKSRDEISNYTFLAFGGAGSSSNDISPYLCYFFISPNGEITQNPANNTTLKKKSYRFAEFMNSRFKRVIKPISSRINTGEGNNGKFTPVFVASMIEKISSSSNTTSTKIIRLSEHLEVDFDNHIYTFNNFITDWRTSSVPATYIQSMAFDDDGIYVIGYKKTRAGKSTPPSNGDLWHTGYVAKLNYQGNVEIQKTVLGSPVDDKFYNVEIEGDYLYLSGKASTYSTSESGGKYFGYGWLVKLDKSTFSVKNSILVGKETEHAVFYATNLQNGSLFLGGYNSKSSKQDEKAYFWEINKNGL